MAVESLCVGLQKKDRKCRCRTNTQPRVTRLHSRRMRAMSMTTSIQVAQLCQPLDDLSQTIQYSPDRVIAFCTLGNVLW